MSGEASLQTLPNQREAAVHAASPSTEKPAWQEISSEQTAAEELAAPGQGGLADHASSKSPAAPEPSRPASLAAALRSDRSTFLEVLDHAVGGGVARAVARDHSEQSVASSDDEGAVFERIMASLVADRAALIAVVVGAALAARTVAHVMFRTENDFDPAAAEALLAAWLNAARALLRLRGTEGLLRLVPAARNLARRAAEHPDVAPAIAEAMRRVAARIADAEHSLRPAPRHSPQRRERERIGEAFMLPRRIVIRGQLQLEFHAH